MFTAKSNDIWAKNDNKTIPFIKHKNYKYYIHSTLTIKTYENHLCFLKCHFIICRKLTKHFQPELFDTSDFIICNIIGASICFREKTNLLSKYWISWLSWNSSQSPFTNCLFHLKKIIKRVFEQNYKVNQTLN